MNWSRSCCPPWRGEEKLYQLPYNFLISTYMAPQAFFDGPGISVEQAREAFHSCDLSTFHPLERERNVILEIANDASVFFVEETEEGCSFRKEPFVEFLTFYAEGWDRQRQGAMTNWTPLSSGEPASISRERGLEMDMSIRGACGRVEWLVFFIFVFI